MRITATDAKNRFGSVCAQAKRQPVFVEKAGQVDTVILSVEHYQTLCDGPSHASLKARRKAFESEFKAWIAEQHTWVESQGIPGEELRPW